MREAVAIPVLIALVVAVISDLCSRKIPNWLVLPLLLCGLGESFWIEGWSGLRHSIAGGLLGFGVFLIPFFLGGMGAGDVKLCAAIGAWIWPEQLLVALVITGLAGGVIAVFSALFGGYFVELLSNTGNMIAFWRRRSDKSEPSPVAQVNKRRSIPYSPAIAIGTAVSFLHTLR